MTKSYNKYNYNSREWNKARPKPKILLEWTDPKTYRSEQVLAAGAIYAVYYNGEPINLRSLSTLVNYPGPKYKKVSFSNSGHAFNLCDRLNQMFQTHKFTVVKLMQGEIVTRDDKRNPRKSSWKIKYTSR